MSKELLCATSFCLMTFPSTHHALRAEKTLEKSKKTEILIMPTPREISNGCGLSIKFYLQELDVVKSLLENSKIEYSGVFNYSRDLDRNKSTIQKID